MHPNPWLDQPVADFDFTKLDAKHISQQMIQVMLKENGIGLSANQVELDAKIFVMQPQNSNQKPITCINPCILSVSDESVLMQEGCLSFPNLLLKITRPYAITVKYIDTDQKECIIKLDDIDARIFLHEFDHLLGITFVNRVSKMKLEMAKKKQRKNYA